LGLIFLLTNLKADWRLSGAWIAAIVLGALGSWLVYRRWEMVRAWSAVTSEGDGAHSLWTARMICQIRGPILLLVLALLFALQAAGVRTLGQTWGVLLIAFGGLLLVERMAGRSALSPGYLPTTPAAPGSAASPRKDGQ
jgi:hypothetical protein